MQRRSFLSGAMAGLGTALATTRPAVAQFIPNPSKERWAILFGTWYGTARDASVWVSEGMGGIAAVFDIRQVPADLASYDHVVVGTSIHAGKGRQELEAYLESNRARLQGKIRGLFACCGNLGKMPGPRQTEDFIDNYLAKLCGVGSVPHRVFGGRITKAVTSSEDYALVEGLYRRLGLPLADYDNLSRLECLRLGKEILTAREATLRGYGSPASSFSRRTSTTLFARR